MPNYEQQPKFCPECGSPLEVEQKDGKTVGYHVHTGEPIKFTPTANLICTKTGALIGYQYEGGWRIPEGSTWLMSRIEEHAGVV